MSPNGPSDYAPRVRAAHAYAGLKLDELAAALDISVRTLTRFESGEREPDYELRQRVAAICGVPNWFLEHGFNAEYVEPDTDERLEALAHHIETQDQVLAHIREIVAARADVLEQQAREIIRMRGWLEDLAGRVTQPEGRRPSAPEAEVDAAFGALAEEGPPTGTPTGGSDPEDAGPSGSGSQRPVPRRRRAR